MSLYQAFFSNMEGVALPMFAFGLFVFAFALVLLRTFGFKTRGDYDALAALPLSDQEQPAVPEVKS